MQKFITLFLSVILVLFTFFYVINVYYWNDTEQPNAKSGLLDLSNVNFGGNQTVKLNGEWEFYPGVFIEPDSESLAFEAYRDQKQIIKVPGRWDNYITNEKPYGTYRLIIKVPPFNNFGVKAGMIGFASKMYVNGKEVGSSGNVTDRYSEFNNSGYNAFFNSDSNKLELVIHVSSFKVKTGGITRPIKFGPSENILFDRDLYKM